jgi:hypothetical protein
MHYRSFRFCLTHSKFPPQVLREREIINTVLSAVLKKNGEKKDTVRKFYMLKLWLVLLVTGGVVINLRYIL